MDTLTKKVIPPPSPKKSNWLQLLGKLGLRQRDRGDVTVFVPRIHNGTYHVLCMLNTIPTVFKNPKTLR